MERSNGAVKTAFHIQVEGKRGPGQPKVTWKQLTERDCREWKLSAINPHVTWRSGVRSALRAASQFSGRGPNNVDVPLYLHVNQKSNYDMIFISTKNMGSHYKHLCKAFLWVPKIGQWKNKKNINKLEDP